MMTLFTNIICTIATLAAASITDNIKIAILVTDMAPTAPAHKRNVPVLLLACSQDWTYNLQMIQSWLQASSNTGILNTCTRLWLTESEQAPHPRWFNKGRSSKFREGSWVRQTPGEGWRTYRPKHCGNNNKDEDNSPKTLNDKNHQASSQKFRHPSINLSNVTKILSDLFVFTLSRSQVVSKLADRSRGRPEGSLFNSYNIEV